MKKLFSILLQASFVIFNSFAFAQDNNLLPHVTNISVSNAVSGQHSAKTSERAKSLVGRRVIEGDEDNLYVIEPSFGNIREIDDLGFVTHFVTGLNTPTGITKGYDGNFYVCELFGTSIKRVTPGGIVSFLVEDGYSFYDIIQGLDSNFYALEANFIVKITPEGTMSLLKGGFEGPHSIVQDKNGNFYLSERELGNIKKISQDGSTVTTFKSGLSSPRGLAVDHSGVVYAATASGILKLYPDNSVDTVSSEFTAAEGLSLGKNNEIFFTDSDTDKVWEIYNSYQIEIQEHSADNTLVASISAKDFDDQALSYRIISGNVNEAFQIDANTGQLRVNDSQKLDYEATKSFVLTIGISDGVGETEIDITVDLVDVIETPMITSIEAEKYAFQQSRQSVTKINSSLTVAEDIVQAYGGNFYITEPDSNRVIKIDPSGEASTFIEDIEGLSDITVGIDGTLYIVANYEIYKVDPSGQLEKMQFDGYPPYALHAVQGMDYGFYVNNSLQIVRKQLSSSEETVEEEDSVITDDTYPSYLVSDINQGHDRAIYVVERDSESGRFGRINAQGTFVILADSIRYPTKAVQDADGSWYLSASYAVKKIDSEGNITDYLTSNIFPRGLTFGEDGNLYVISRQGLWKVAMNYRFTVKTNAPLGAAVAQIKATDPNDDSLSYRITDGNTDGLFAVDNAGVITITDSSAWAASHFLHTLSIEVSDGLNTSQTVRINILKQATFTPNPQITRVIDPVGIEIDKGLQIREVVRTDYEVVSFAFDNGDAIYAVVDTSDFSSSRTLWKILPNGEKTEYKEFIDPISVISDSQGNIYVSWSNKITLIGTDGKQQLIVADDGGCENMVIGTDSCIYCADTPNGADGRIRRITMQGEVSLYADGFGWILGLTIGPDNALYINEYDRGEIKRVELDGSDSTILSGQENLSGLAFGQDNQVYFYNSSYYQFVDDEIRSFSVGEDSSEFIGGLEYVKSMLVSPKNDLYVGTGYGISLLDWTYSTPFRAPFTEGRNIAQVIAIDPLDENATLTYNISSGNEESIFAIDPTSGQLSLANTEVVNSDTDTAIYRLEVSVSNGIRQATETVEIVLINQTTEESNHITSINKETPNTTKFNIYPNPTTNYLNINLGGVQTDKARIDISTLSGQIIYTHQYNSLDQATKRIDISGIPKGIYLVKFTTSNTRVSKTVIIK